MASDAAQATPLEWQLPNEHQSDEEPLLDCLVVLSAHWQRGASAASITMGLPVPEQGFTPELFVRGADRIGLRARIVKRPLTALSNWVLPAVLLMRGRQAAIVSSIDAGAKTVTLLQPESDGGQVCVSFDTVVDAYLGYAIFVAPKPLDETPATGIPSNATSRHWFWGPVFDSWRLYRDAFVASLLINMFALVTPLFVMNVYDRVVPNGALDTLWVLTSGVVIVFLFDLLLRAVRGYFVDIASKKTDVVLSSRMFEQIMAIKMAVRPTSVGAFANKLHEFNNIRDFITSASILTLVDLPFVCLFLVVIAYIGGPIALAPATAIVMVALYGLIIQLPLRRAVEKVYRTSATSHALLIEGLTGIETVKTSGAEGELQHQWEQAIGHIANWGVRARTLAASAVTVTVFIQQLTTVAVVVWGVYLVADAQLSLGALIACVILAGRAMAPAAGVATLATRYHQARTALRGLDEVMRLPIERPANQSYVPRKVIRGDVEFRHVAFSYPNQDGIALRHIAFRIAARERVAIIGRIGSGKTTLHKLIMGLYEASEGTVLIDGTDVRQIDPADLRRHIGYVPQDIVLFNGTVRNNIVLGHPNTDDAGVMRAADTAGLTDLINQHPHGLNMSVGERGEGLSGGQRQRVAIARAVLTGAPILLMDEPSHAMDSSSEEQLKARLKPYLADKTFILTTHRASLLELVERIIVIDGGRIIADGPRDQIQNALKQGKLSITRPV